MPNEGRPKLVWKGKGKDFGQDYAGLNPVITYRHILSANLGVRDPLRVIALCDSDAFYAACEMVRLGVDKDTPLVVLQWDSLIAVNYPARAYGITRMSKVKDALQKCPHLKVVHVATYREGEAEPGYWDDVDTKTHKVSLDYYRRESIKVSGMYKEGLPGCEVEKASIDEAFIDFTQRVRELLLQRYPHLAHIPQDAVQGIDTPVPPPPPLLWDGPGDLIPIEPDSDEPENMSTTSADTHQKFLLTTWHDIALSIAAELMHQVRVDIFHSLGYSTSAGIARNKFLAKLTASHRKPNGQSILRNAAIPNYLRPLPFQKIRNLGGKLGVAIAKEYDAATRYSRPVCLDEMQQRLSENAIWVWEILRGIDRSEVKEKPLTNKSMMAVKNLPKLVTKLEEGYHWIRILAAELALRLNDARKESPGLWPKSIVLHARKGYETSKSKQMQFPFSRDVTVDGVAKYGNKLWKELVGESSTINVSAVTLGFSGIETATANQKRIESFLRAPKRGRDDEAENEHLPIEVPIGQHGPIPATLARQSIQCDRCCRLIVLDKDVAEDGIQDALALLKMEHDDFHFAQDLAKESDSSVPSTAAQTKRISKHNKRPKQEPRGIEKFFSRKTGDRTGTK
ncbi:hypothetical protein AX16_002345 [Volvariella volvacea WC 439]|nr:hypothetical protein AX16_002345 [Volvariella volvacea WC 439]